MEDNNYIEVKIPEDRKELFAELKKKYNPEGSILRKYQLHLTKTLVEFDTFCKEHDIKYSLAYGTMIGAIRHKGFIPWDDDADLFMDRENYEKLHKLMKGDCHELTPTLSVAMGIRPELWSPPFAHIDIFILDKSPDNIIIRLIKQYTAILLYSLVKARGRIDSNSLKDWKKIRPWYCFIPFALLASKKYWKKVMKKNALSFNRCRSTHFQSYYAVAGGIKMRYSIRDCEQYNKIEFEGNNFPIFSGYSNILKILYGDYMSLPNKLHEHGIVNNVDLTDLK